jgi:predicted transcriptional regulator
MAHYIVAMATTIQISKQLIDELKTMKMSEKESYEDIIWDLIEDHMELSEETKRNIAEAKKQIAKGNFYTHEQVKKELGL